MRFVIISVILIISCTGQKELIEKQRSESPKKLTENNDQKALEYFSNGSIFMSNEDYAAALNEFYQALQYDDNSSELFKNIAYCQIKLKRFDLAELNLNKCIAIDPVNMEALDMLGLVYISLQKAEDAVQVYLKMLKLEPSNTKAFEMILYLYELQKKITEMLHFAEKNRNTIDITANTGYIIASYYLNQKNYDKSREWITLSLQKDPENKKAKLLKAQLDLIQGNTKQSIDELKKMQENDPENQNLLIGTVEILRQEKKFDEIIELLKSKQGLNQPLQLYLGEAYYFKKDWNNLRETYANIPLQNFNIYFEIIIAEGELRSRNYETAIAYYHSILKRDSSESFAYYGLGFSLIQQKRYDEAETILQKGLKKAKDKSNLYNLLSDALLELNKTDNAIQMLLQLEKENPDDWQVKASLANAYQKTGNIKESDAYFESAIKISNNVSLMNNYAYNLSKREMNLDRAEDLMKKALTEEPNNSYFLDTMGWIYYKKKKYQLAKSFVIKAIEQRDQQEESYELFDHLGDIYLALNEMPKALLNWKKALEIDSKQKSIREKIEKYEKKK